jgi:hypothetical protein
LGFREALDLVERFVTRSEADARPPLPADRENDDFTAVTRSRPE